MTKQMNIALQLWSIQDDCEKDFPGTLRKVSEMGYEGVEFAGYYGMEAEELKALLNELNLEVAGSHIPYEAFKNNFEETIAYERKIGNTRLVIPFMEGETLEEWQAHFESLREIQEKLPKDEFKLLYHNHAHEFTTIEGVDVIDEMTKALPNLLLEVDTYWLKYADREVIKWLENHADKVELLHIKEMKETEDGFESTEISSGILPLKNYIDFAHRQGLEWLIVEQEAFQTLTPMESAAINYTNLKALL
ncbi:sugar phosphate isomerase/epimerase family protein [Fundicoccus sp. Sow4_D5]|uniref:sugar phosphate isomerase/epimerase family protein n=1 Tax=unclassified Fundicoccus TaxID=2761543 RepID=UPI003F8F278E